MELCLSCINPSICKFQIYLHQSLRQPFSLFVFSLAVLPQRFLFFFSASANLHGHRCEHCKSSYAWGDCKKQERYDIRKLLKRRLWDMVCKEITHMMKGKKLNQWHKPMVTHFTCNQTFKLCFPYVRTYRLWGPLEAGTHCQIRHRSHVFTSVQCLTNPELTLP